MESRTIDLPLSLPDGELDNIDRLAGLTPKGAKSRNVKISERDESRLGGLYSSDLTNRADVHRQAVAAGLQLWKPDGEQTRGGATYAVLMAGVGALEARARVGRERTTWEDAHREAIAAGVPYVQVSRRIDKDPDRRPVVSVPAGPWIADLVAQGWRAEGSGAEVAVDPAAPPFQADRFVRAQGLDPQSSMRRVLDRMNVELAELEEIRQRREQADTDKRIEARRQAEAARVAENAARAERGEAPLPRPLPSGNEGVRPSWHGYGMPAWSFEDHARAVAEVVQQAWEATGAENGALSDICGRLLIAAAIQRHLPHRDLSALDRAARRHVQDWNAPGVDRNGLPVTFLAREALRHVR